MAWGRSGVRVPLGPQHVIHLSTRSDGHRTGQGFESPWVHMIETQLITVPANLPSLISILKKFNIPINEWGKGYAKTPQHLFEELKNHDSYLTSQNNELTRRVDFVDINVLGFFDGKKHQLIEEKQVFNENTLQERIRTRHYATGAVSEKIHIGEQPEKAALRALAEELGIRNDNLFLQPTSTTQTKRTSLSYPGLNSEYRGFFYETQLNPSQIVKTGYKETQPDKTTYFSWIEI